MNNKDKLAEIINSQKQLAENLTHEIHRDDEVTDSALHNIHQLSRDYEKQLEIRNCSLKKFKS